MSHYKHGNIIISYICSRVSRNIGIVSKLRHYLSPHQLKQIYYNLIYPYLSYAMIAWGSAYKTYLQMLQSKQNIFLRLMFFATTSGPYTESTLPFFNFLDILTVDNVYHPHALKFTHNYVVYRGCLITYFNMQRADIHTTKGMHQSKISANHVFEPILDTK